MKAHQHKFESFYVATGSVTAAERLIIQIWIFSRVNTEEICDFAT